VNRTEFDAIRDIPGKVIEGDIKFARRQATLPALTAENIAIVNTGGVELRLNITYNPDVGSKTFNVYVPGVGPICRLDVDGPAHRPAGRSHKHSVQIDRCSDRNLRDGVVDRPDLAGKTLADLFSEFCHMAKITHAGTFEAPAEEAP
jgi:hypothetical protein